MSLTVGSLTKRRVFVSVAALSQLFACGVVDESQSPETEDPAVSQSAIVKQDSCGHSHPRPHGSWCGRFGCGGRPIVKECSRQRVVRGRIVTEAINENRACGDDDPCKGEQTCQAGRCVALQPPVIDDGDPCTLDACDRSVGITHVPVADGTACSDGNLCNGLELCVAGKCEAGTPPAVDDNDPCTIDSCNEASGASHVAAADGTPCPDGNRCNGDELCVAGTCAAGTPVVVDDGDPCTADACDTAMGAIHVPIEGCSATCDAPVFEPFVYTNSTAAIVETADLTWDLWVYRDRLSDEDEPRWQYRRAGD